MKAVFKIITAAIITVLLILTAVFAISGTAAAQDRGVSREQQQYLREREESYVRAVRAALAEKGYSDSGVVMNRITNEDGSMEYLVKLHHRRLLKLDAKEQTAVLEPCKELELPAEGCGIEYEFF